MRLRLPLLGLRNCNDIGMISGDQIEESAGWTHAPAMKCESGLSAASGLLLDTGSGKGV